LLSPYALSFKGAVFILPPDNCPLHPGKSYFEQGILIPTFRKNESRSQPSSIITTAEKKSQGDRAKKPKIVPISEKLKKSKRCLQNYPFENRGRLCIWG